MAYRLVLMGAFFTDRPFFLWGGCMIVRPSSSLRACVFACECTWSGHWGTGYVKEGVVQEGGVD